LPLAFDSTTHGTIAFGFFNIDSDMLLLENRFFFAGDLCALLVALSAEGADEVGGELPGWVIERRSDVGDLMGAIRGSRHVGFIGDTYLRYPFPLAPEDFRQRPEGDRTRDEFAGMIGRYAAPSRIVVTASRSAGAVSIGGIGFTRGGFHELVRYVWRGGYPRWRDEVRPGCVVAMREALDRSASWLFDGIDWAV
jgi:hypothetical protein